MKCNKQFMTALSGLLLLCATGIAAFPASSHAATAPSVNSLSPEDELHFRQTLTEYDVPSQTQDLLVTKVHSGQQLDSMNPQKEPVAVSIQSSDKEDITIQRFEDGSVAVLALEKPQHELRSGVSPASAPHSCSRSGTKRLNCTVDAWVGLVSMSFKANFDTATDKVWGANSPSWTVIGACSVSLTSLENTAFNTARMTSSASACVPYSTTMWLQLKVTKGNAVESWG